MDTTVITIRIPQDKKNKIDEYCGKHKYKRSDFYRDLIDRFISIQEEQEKQLNEQIKKEFYENH